MTCAARAELARSRRISTHNGDLVSLDADAAATIPAAGIRGLTAQELNSFPVPGTWSVQQVIFHLMDSDLICSDRMKRVIAWIRVIAPE